MNDQKEPEQWLLLNQKSPICTHTKELKHDRQYGHDSFYIACTKCKTLWSLAGDE